MLADIDQLAQSSNDSQKPYLCDRVWLFYNGRTESDIQYKMAIHHIQMDPVRSGV